MVQPLRTVKPADPNVRAYLFLAGPMRFTIYSASKENALAQARARLRTLLGKWVLVGDRTYSWVTL